MLYQLGESRVRAEGEYWVADNAVVVGNVLLKEGASVWFNAVVRGDNELITIGEGSNVQDGAVLHTDPGCPLTIGPHVTVGHKVMLHGCEIGDRVLVGMQATVMDGAIVEDDVVIAAGALVTPGKRLRSGYLYAGAPAVERRPLSEREMDYFTYVANNYVKLKQQHLEELEG